MDKLCTKCNKTLHSSDFYKNKARKDGLQTYCKQCMSITNSEGFQKHKKKNGN